MAPKPPASLVRHLREGRCVLFAGSGLSAWGKLPTWGGLLQHIIGEMRAEEPDSPSIEELDRLLEAGKLLEIADYCKEQLGERRYGEILTEQLRGDEGDIPEPHRIIAELPFAAVVTTNYDKLLERTYASLTGRWPKTPTHLDSDTLGPLLFDGSFFILKAHGDIDRPDSLVLTASDYREIIHSNPAFNEIFSAILLTNAILFVGYSLNDPDLRMLLDRQLATFQGHVPERYALMSGVGSVECDVLWRTARIKVLPYAAGQHDEVVNFLNNLQYDLEQYELKQQEVEKGLVLEEVAPIPKALEMPTAEVRRPSPIPSTILSIRLRGRQIEAAVATGDRAVIAQGAGPFPDWSFLAPLLRSAVRPWRSDAGEKSRDEVGQTLAQCLSGNVLRALQEVPPDNVIRLRLSAEIETLPWEWTYVRENYLFLCNPVARTPIGISDEARGHPPVRQPVRVLLIGDPGGNLPGARTEIEKIAEVYDGYPGVSCTTLIGSQAAFDTVVREFRGGDYDVVHFAGHAWFDEHEAYLALSDGDVLWASQLRSFLSPQPPAILILNSHFTAFVPPGFRIEEEEREKIPDLGAGDIAVGATLRGKGSFTEAASTAGVGAFIGCFGSPSDAMAARIGIDLHKELLEGTPVAVALHKARLSSLREDEPDLTGLLYVMSGYPELVLK